MFNIERRLVEVIPLSVENFDGLENAYNIEFRELSSSEMGILGDAVRIMCTKREAQVSMEDGPFPESKAVLYLPVAVLKRELMASEVKSINTAETERVARYTTDIQKQIAAVPIMESLEDLVYLPSVMRSTGADASFSDMPFHQACGAWAGKGREFWVRERFAKRLSTMALLLNATGVKMHFEDAFRPVGVQEGLFKRRVDWTRRDYPEWTEKKIIEEAKSKTAVMARLASHKGGAAVDATLETMGGQKLSFGHEYPDGGALVFPKTPFVTADQWINRQIFQVAAGLSGLTLYVGEDWHVSYGDNLASLDSGGNVQPKYVANYGPIRSFVKEGDRGIITEVYTEEEMDEVFPTD